MISKTLLGACLLLAVVVSNSEATAREAVEAAKLASNLARLAKTKPSPGVLQEVIEASGAAREAPGRLAQPPSTIARGYFAKRAPGVAENRQIFAPKSMVRNGLMQQQRAFFLSRPQIIKKAMQQFQSPSADSSGGQEELDLPDANECKKSLRKVSRKLFRSQKLKDFTMKVVMDQWAFGRDDDYIRELQKDTAPVDECREFSAPLEAVFETLKGCDVALDNAEADFRDVVGQKNYDTLEACKKFGGTKLSFTYVTTPQKEYISTVPITTVN